MTSEFDEAYADYMLMTEGWKDWVQDGLATLGVIGDVFGGSGAPFDAINGLIFLTRKDLGAKRWLLAALSFISIVPGAGDAVAKPIYILLRMTGKNKVVSKRLAQKMAKTVIPNEQKLRKLLRNAQNLIKNYDPDNPDTHPDFLKNKKRLRAMFDKKLAELKAEGNIDTEINGMLAMFDDVIGKIKSGDFGGKGAVHRVYPNQQT